MSRSPARSIVHAAACCALLGSLAGCGSLRIAGEGAAPAEVTLFSNARPGGRLPGGWEPWRMSRLKRMTEYRLVDYDGTVVVKAMSAASASGLIHRLDIDPRELPVLEWRWKVPQLIEGAENSSRAREDSPVRIVLSFDGDVGSLALEDRLFFDRVRALTGHQMPYATLMYIWENRAPKGTVIPNPHTGRIQMVVAESGPDRTGAWKLESRDIEQDFRRAFGEAPGRLRAIAILTDTDNTGATVEAYYGDIRLRRAAEATGEGLAGASDPTARAPGR